MDVGSLGYRTDLAVLEAGGSELTDCGEYVVVRTPGNPTYWWGSFLLFATPFAPGSVEQRLETFRTEFPEARHVAIGIDTVDGSVGAEDELAAAGLEIDRSTVMTATRALEPARPNATAEYRFLASDDDWEQSVTLTLVASSWMEIDAAYEEFTRRKVMACRALVESGRAVWFGAFEGERLLASLGLVPDGKGAVRFQTVQTHPDARGRGLASALVHRASTYALRELDAETLVMVADPEYSAIRLYRALGLADTEVMIQVMKPSPGE